MKTAFSIQNQLIGELLSMSVVIESTSPGGSQVDAEIKLGGAHEGIHIQVGTGYYNVVKENPDGAFIFINGRGKIAAELKQSIAA